MKNDNNNKNKKRKKITGYLILAVLGLVCIILFLVAKNNSTTIIKDYRIYYCQPLLDEYEKLELTSYQVESVDIDSDTLDTEMEGAIVISFKTTIDKGNPQADKEAIIRCTDNFMKMNPDNELKNNKLAFFFQEGEGPMYNKEAFYENGVLVMSKF